MSTQESTSPAIGAKAEIGIHGTCRAQIDSLAHGVLSPSLAGLDRPDIWLLRIELRGRLVVDIVRLDVKVSIEVVSEAAFCPITLSSLLPYSADLDSCLSDQRERPGFVLPFDFLLLPPLVVSSVARRSAFRCIIGIEMRLLVVQRGRGGALDDRARVEKIPDNVSLSFARAGGVWTHSGLMGAVPARNPGRASSDVSGRAVTVPSALGGAATSDMMLWCGYICRGDHSGFYLDNFSRIRTEVEVEWNYVSKLRFQPTRHHLPEPSLSLLSLYLFLSIFIPVVTRRRIAPVQLEHPSPSTGQPLCLSAKWVVSD